MLACRRARCENCVRHDLGTARLYISGFLDLPDFVRQTFEAEEIERLPAQGGFHMEAKMGDSIVMMEICEDAKKFGEPAAICVFVPDVDAAYDRAMRAEATSIKAPEGKPYDQPGDGVKDTFGNTWWIATYQPRGSAS